MTPLPQSLHADLERPQFVTCVFYVKKCYTASVFAIPELLERMPPAEAPEVPLQREWISYLYPLYRFDRVWGLGVAEEGFDLFSI